MAIFGKNKTETTPSKATEKKPASVKVAKDNKKKTEKKVEKKTSMKDLYGDAKPAIKAKEKEGEVKKTNSSLAYKILIKPLITEKAANLGKENKYVFEVKESSNKIEIAKAIEDAYSIRPIGVNVVRMGGKKVRSGKRAGRRKDWKKAVVTLPEGKTINIYEGV